MSGNMVNIGLLPLEIWLHILRFLPPRCVRQLLGVHRLFYALALDDIYNSLTLLSTSLKSYERVRHVLSDRQLASRVRHLHINPSWQFSPNSCNIARRLRTNCLDVLRWVKAIEPSDPGPTWRRIFTTRRKHFDVATTALSHCSNVCELTIVTQMRSSTPLYEKFLGTLWVSMGARIQTLNLRVNLDQLRFLAQSVANAEVSFGQVEKLALHLSVTSSAQHQGVAVLASLLPPIISKIRHSLRFLAISSYHALHLPSILEGLGHIPKLAAVRFTLPFTRVTLPDPSAFTRFLNRHQESLEHLALRRIFLDIFREMWSSDHVGIKYPSFKVLKLALKSRVDFRVGQQPHPMLLPNLAHLSASLTTLHLTETFFEYDQVEVLITSLVRGSQDAALENLQINVVSLSPELFDLLSSTLRKLRSLDLAFRHVLSHKDNTKEHRTMFRDAMGTRAYPHWPLGFIKLSRQTHCERGERDVGLMQLLAACVPSVYEFGSEDACTCLAATSDNPWRE